MTETIPKHLGLVIDGNRRWARERNLPTLEGHRVGLENFKELARFAFNSGVQYVSAYVFSTENWDRTKEEVDYLMGLVVKTLKKEMKSLIKENIKIVILGDRSDEKVPKKVADAIREVEEASKNKTGGTLAFCFNYGGLQEIADAIKQIVKKGIDASNISKQTLLENLYHPEIPPVDFMVRTSGEERISNFMLPRLAYAELYFSKKYWPDFTEKDLEVALEDYANRQRRHGK